MIAPIWYVLAVAPQREMLVKLDLHRLGLLADVPTERRFKRVRGKNGQPLMVPYSHPMIASYVFVGSPEPIPWSAVKQVDHVRGWVTFRADGTPARLSAADVVAIGRLAEQRDASGGSLRIGDAARVRSLDLAGVVKAIGKHEVTVDVVMFGGPREVVVTVDNVERV